MTRGDGGGGARGLGLEFARPACNFNGVETSPSHGDLPGYGLLNIDFDLFCDVLEKPLPSNGQAVIAGGG